MDRSAAREIIRASKAVGAIFLVVLAFIFAPVFLMHDDSGAGSRPDIQDNFPLQISGLKVSAVDLPDGFIELEFGARNISRKSVDTLWTDVKIRKGDEVLCHGTGNLIAGTLEPGQYQSTSGWEIATFPRPVWAKAPLTVEVIFRANGQRLNKTLEWRPAENN